MSLAFPPLTSLDVLPLHGGRIEGRDAPFACQVELAFDLVFFDWRCDGCLHRAIGYLDALGDKDMRWVPANGEPAQRVSLLWNIERARYWRAPAEEESHE